MFERSSFGTALPLVTGRDGGKRVQNEDMSSVSGELYEDPSTQFKL